MALQFSRRGLGFRVLGLGGFWGFAAWRHLWSSRSKRPPTPSLKSLPTPKPSMPGLCSCCSCGLSEEIGRLAGFGSYKYFGTSDVGARTSCCRTFIRALPENVYLLALGFHRCIRKHEELEVKDARTSEVPRKQAVVLPLNLQAGLRSRFENTGALPLPHNATLSTANMFLHCAAQRHPS